MRNVLESTTKERVTHYVGLLADSDTFKGEPLWILLLLSVLMALDFALFLSTVAHYLYTLETSSLHYLYVPLTIAVYNLGAVGSFNIYGRWAARPLKELLLFATGVTLVGNFIYLAASDPDLSSAGPIIAMGGRFLVGIGAGHVVVAPISLRRYIRDATRTCFMN